MNASQFLTTNSAQTGEQMGEVIQFRKPDPVADKARLIQQSRALYESVFPTEKSPGIVPPNTPVR
jgi:hypothetical protein